MRIIPRNVRNFWIECDIDGRESTLSGGPRAKDGGIDITLYQRDKGSIITAATIKGRVSGDGTLTLDIRGKEGKVELVLAQDQNHIRIKTER